MGPERRPGGYVSIHERRMELFERSILGPGRRPLPGGEAGHDGETIELRSIPGLIAGFVGLAIQGVSAAFPYLLAAWFAPAWFLVVQYLAWALGMRMAMRSREDHPWLALAVPFVSIGSWTVAISIGTSMLGWDGGRVTGAR